MNIFEIQDEYMMIMRDLEQWFLDNPDSDGELPDEFEERLNINKDEALSKIEAYYYVIKQLEAEQDALKFEIDRLKLKVLAKTRHIDNLKSRVAKAVDTFGSNEGKSKSKSIKTLKVKASFVHTNPVVIIDESKIPVEYFRHHIEVKSINRAGAMKAVEALKVLGIEADNTYEVAKKNLGAALKERPVPGAKLDEDAGYVRFS